jgi:CRP/FNR family transcriptional regulator, anaerobic regulatory protein
MDSARFALHRPELFDPLTRGEEKIAALMRGTTAQIAAGKQLIPANTEHSFVYRLLRGWAGRARTLSDGRNQYILIFLPGDLFAVKSMFVTRHSDAVLAISGIVVERVHYNTLHEAYVTDSDIATRCTWQVMEEERRLHDWVVGLGQGSAEERLAMVLMDFKGRLSDGSRADESLSYDMPLTQSQLADHLGVTAVHMNRVLKEFRDAGIVTVRNGRVTITDLPSLVQRAMPLLDAYERNHPAYVGCKYSQ